MSVTPIPEGLEPAAISPADAAELAGGTSLYSAGEFQLTAIIFAFGLTAMIGFWVLVRSRQATPFNLRMYVIIILVFGTLLVVSSAYTTAQIAPVVGFFGTIAGYLLGRNEKSPGGAKGRDLEGEGDE